jgi:ubiquinol-cytochrome c reductase iron-sulfur subunit
MSSGNEPKPPTEAELAKMDREQLLQLGGQMDGVELVEYPDPWPVEGTRAEKRAERAVAAWFTLAAIAGLAFLVAMVAWPWEYQSPLSDEAGHFWYSLYTPVLGLTLGVSILAFAFGIILYTKKFIPHEVAVQQRNDNLGQGSPEPDKQTILAHFADAGNRSTIARRSLIKRSAGLGVGVLGLGAAVLPVIGLVRNPHADADNKDGLMHTGWQQVNGEKVFLRRHTGFSHEISLVRPEDLDAGSIETVFPFRESERGDTHALLEAVRRSDNPVMLIRLRPQDGARVTKRKGQEDFNYGDYYAYSKICTHVGCPTSLFEQRTNLLLCPCHQSQFNMLEYAKPVFGPATRALPQLPIEVDEETGYFVARGDFIEAIGPGFWERKS